MAIRVLCLEFATGGGAWEDPSLAQPGNPFVTEGALMLGALVESLLSIDGVEVTVLRDHRFSQGAVLVFPAPVAVRDIASVAEWRGTLSTLPRHFDWTIPIAPECDGLLERVTDQIELGGGRLASPRGDIVRLGADKQCTAEWLAGQGLPTPSGRRIGAGESLPRDAVYPAVLKPVDGAGSQGLLSLDQWRDDFVVPSHDRGWRLERRVPGRPASVLVGSRSTAEGANLWTLPASWQELSADGSFQYLGGETPIPPPLDRRARRLALRAARTLPPWTGYLGFDLILGDDEDGSSDFIIELNPRLTTSFVGVSKLLRESPYARILANRKTGLEGADLGGDEGRDAFDPPLPWDDSRKSDASPASVRWRV